MHDTLNDVGIVYLNSEPYAIAVMATNLSTLDAGYRFIQGVSRVAYRELSQFSLWRTANDFAPAAAPAALDVPAPAVAAPGARPDVQMWTPPSLPASALPVSASPAAEDPPAGT